MKEYVVKKSVMGYLNFWRILSCIFIIPIIVIVFKSISIKMEKITFVEDKVIWEKGIFSKKVKKFSFNGIHCVNYEQSLWGKIFNYGNLRVDFIGRYDINTDYIQNPKEVVEFLENYIIKTTEAYMR